MLNQKLPCYDRDRLCVEIIHLEKYSMCSPACLIVAHTLMTRFLEKSKTTVTMHNVEVLLKMFMHFAQVSIECEFHFTSFDCADIMKVDHEILKNKQVEMLAELNWIVHVQLRWQPSGLCSELCCRRGRQPSLGLPCCVFPFSRLQCSFYSDLACFCSLSPCKIPAHRQ